MLPTMVHGQSFCILTCNLISVTLRCFGKICGLIPENSHQYPALKFLCTPDSELGQTYSSLVNEKWLLLMNDWHSHYTISTFLAHLAKGNVSFRHHLASVDFSHFNLLWNPLSQIKGNLLGSIYGRSSLKVAHFVPIH